MMKLVKAIYKDMFWELVWFVVIMGGTILSDHYRLFSDYSYYVNFLFVIPAFAILGYKKFMQVFHITNLAHNTSRFKTQLVGTVEQVHSSCIQLNETTENQASAIAQTSSSAQEVTALANKNYEIFQTVNESVNNIIKTIDISSQSSKKLELDLKDGAKTNEEVVKMMGETIELLNELISQFKQVVDKTAVINEIVFQTKLLSFNASVEAARAGEHGKGFAVVAEEIGSLAQMSGDSARSIQDTLSETEDKVQLVISNISKRSVTLEKALKEQAESGSKALSEFGYNFQNVSDVANQISSQVDKLSEALDEQTKSMQEINLATVDINESVQRNALVVNQTLNLAEEINKDLNVFDSVSRQSINQLVGHDTDELEVIPWSDEYGIDINHIDDEHKKILDYINKLIVAMNSDNMKNIKRVYKELKTFTLEHFAHEEKFMESFNYPSLESHKKVHENLIASVIDFEEKLERGELDKTRLASFLKNWLFTHINGVDKRYAKIYHEDESTYKKSA